MDFDITIIGAGVVGLAIATELSKLNQRILLIEKNAKFGEVTSSRNSEVIHAGIYYEPNSLKAKLCVEGKELLYKWCEQYNVPYVRLGKYIVSVNKEDEENLEFLYQQAIANGVKRLEYVNLEKFHKEEPLIKASKALFSPETGTLDSHKFMQSLENYATNNSVEIVYHHKVVGINKEQDGYAIEVQFQDQKFQILTGMVINSAGLYSDEIAKIIGLDINKLGYRQTFCRGHYFKMSSYKTKIAKHLIYPVPEKNWSGTGVHITLDIAGNLRFGPDVQYLKDNIEDYRIPDERKILFYEDIKRYLPSINYDDLVADQAGIRPKLQKEKEKHKDFIINEESKNGFKGLINLIGIESPGLTASLAIAKYVSKYI